VSPAERTCISCQTPLPSDAVFCPRCGVATPTQVSAGGTTTVAAPVNQTSEQQRRVQAALGPDYEVQHRIGSGGFAEVWAAFDRKLQRTVAVKVMHPDLVASRALLERFQREAQAVAKLRHPGVIPIYAVGEHEGLAYYIMPLVEGESLRDRLTREGPLPPTEVRRILRETAAALAVAHKAGIIHRDIKPENVMLEGDDRRVLVMDFGIAKSTAGTQTGLTGTGMIVGTPTYMSPEQATGSKEVDVRSDIYSLGVVGYELLTGKPPFTSQSVRELLLHHVSTPAPSVAAGRTDIPDDLAIAVNRCLAKDPGERWRDAAELSAFLEVLGTPTAQPKAVSQDLRKFAQPLPVWSRPLGLLGQQARRRVVAAARWVRRVPRWQILVAAAIVLVGSLVLFGQDSVHQTRDIVASWLRGGSVARAALSPGSEGLSTTWSEPIRLLPLADTALGVVAQNDGLAFMDVFNGDHWSRLAGLPDRVDFTPLASRGGLWLLPSRPGSTYRLLGVQFVRQDSCPIGVGSAWTDGDVIVARGPGGAVAIRSGGAWRRLPTGRQHLGRIIGHARDSLYAIGGFGNQAEAHPDSLLSFDGFAWRSLDPRTDQRQLWWYEDGIARSDGGYVVVGRVTTADSNEYGNRTPLVLERDRSGTAWTRENIHWGRRVGDLDRVGEAGGSLFVWAGLGYGMFELVGDSARFIDALRDRGVEDIATMRGRPYVATRDGLLWTREKGEWAVVTAVPGSGEIAAAASGWQQRSATEGWELLPTFAAIGVSGLASVQRIVEAEADVYWLLGRDGRVAHVVCSSRSCAAHLVTAPATRRDTVLDLAYVRGRGVLATGTNDLVATWTGSQWRRETIAGSGPPQTFVRIASDEVGGVLLLGRRSVLRLRRGSQQEVLGNLPSEIGPPVDIAAGPIGSLAVVGSTGLAIRSPATGFMYDQGFRDSLGDQTPTAITFLSDGRLVVATSNADPLLGGRLLVQGASGSWIALRSSERANFYGFQKDYRSHLGATGTGWFESILPYSYVPYASDSTGALQLVSYVQVAPPDAQISVGGTAPFVATTYNKANNPIPTATFVWTSSNPRAATIDQRSGIATGVGPGVAIITAQVATWPNAKSGQATLHVVASQQPQPARRPAP
jgi:hypothetical protein